MIYQIEWLEIKPPTATGKIRSSATLVGQDGNKFNDVSIWADFPDFSNLKPGSSVDGTISYKAYKGKNYASLSPVKNPNGTYTPKPKNDIAKAMDKKNENIQASQDRKEESIKNSLTFRAATDHVIQWRQERTARGMATSTEEWQTEWINVRKWFEARFLEPFNS
jgi:hypothetical protein